MSADPKPAARIRNPRAGRDKLLAEGRCRVCPARSALERHHVVPRSLGGDDVAENTIPLCRRCHGTFEGDWGGHRAAVGSAIRAELRTDELAYVLGKKSVLFLDKYYP